MGKLKVILAFLILFVTSAAAQQPPIKISALPSATTPLSGSEFLYIDQAGISKKVATSALMTSSSSLPLATTSQLYGGSGVAGAASVVSLGSGLSLTGGTLTATGGGGGPFTAVNVTNAASYTVLAPATPSGNILALNLPFMVPGWLVSDSTTPSAIPPGTFVVSLNYFQVVLNNNVSGILLNDTLSFTPSSDFSHGTPCEKITGGMAGTLSGFYFDEYCTQAVGGWHLQWNGEVKGWTMGTPYGIGFTLYQGDDSAAYIPNGGFATLAFPSGFTITNPNYSFPPGLERAVDAGVNAPNGLVNVADASASWATSAMTINTSFGCGASFGLGIQPGQILLDLSLPTGLSTASIIGSIASCDPGTGIITLNSPGAAQGSATTFDTMIGIVQATYSWGGGGLGLSTRAIPMSTCTGINADLGNAITDLSIPTLPVLGSVNQTSCYNQIILTANALFGAAGGADNLLFALPASTAWLTSDTQITVGGCDAIASPEQLVDVTLSPKQTIGAVSTCANNVLALPTTAAHTSSGSTDPLIFGYQATGAWAFNAALIPVTQCLPNTPSQAILLDLTISATTEISVFQGCASPTSILLGAPALQASSGTTDQLVWGRQAYQTWTSGNQIAVNAGTTTGVGSCVGVTAGEIVYDMSVSGGTLIGTVQSCTFYAALSFGGLITLTGTIGHTVTSGDFLVFGTPATTAFTSGVTKAIPVTTCANFFGPAFFDAAVSFDYIGTAAGCGGLVTLTGAAAFASFGPTDNLVPVTPATASWALHATSIDVASCTGFATPQYLVDMTLTTPTVLAQITSCTPGTPNVIALGGTGASVASNGPADLLAPATQSFLAQGSAAAGGNFSWSNAVQNIPVPNCAGASSADAVLDLSLVGTPLIGTIGVCGPTLLLTYPALTASADLEGYAGFGSRDYLMFTARRQGDYRINQNPIPGGFALWAATSAGTVQSPAALIAEDPAGTTWELGNAIQTTPVTIGGGAPNGLPTCAAADAVVNGVMTSVKAGTFAAVSNGVAPPTYWGAVSATGPATDSVFCYYSGSAYSWVYH